MTEFSWTDWHWHLDIITGVLLLEGLYLLGVGPLRQRYEWAERVPTCQVVTFTLAVLVIYVALSSPLHELSDNFLFSAHMVQHLLLMLLIPPLLIWGTPAWLLRPLLRFPVVERAARFLTSPVIAFIVFSGVFSVWHFPPLYDLTLRNHSAHVLEHLLFMATAVVMWWPVLGRLPELPRPSYPIQMVYLFFLSLPPGFVGAVITFSGDILYPWYGEVPRLWGISALTDQQIGGLIMKIPGALVFLVALAVVFFTWFNREESGSQDRSRGEEPLASGQR